MCTEDGCDAKTGCVHLDSTKPCLTGDVCVQHACSAGQCKAVPASPCDDGNPCTTETCDPKTGCKYKDLAFVPCDDGNGCTTADVCKFGVCKGKGGKSCDDGKPCTDDTCDLAGDCTHVQVEKPCNDGSFCTSFDLCAAGQCGGKAKDCDDDDACTLDACNPQSGLCGHAQSADGTACLGVGPCVVGASCQAGLCVGKAKTCDDGNPCTADACNDSNGVCDTVPLADGATCTTLDGCVQSPQCTLGLCSGTPKNCDDLQPCTNDSCDPATGACLHASAPDGGACGEGVLTCQSGVCK